MKIIVLIFAVFSIHQAYSQEFEIIEATSQKWTGGQKRSGYGYYYNLKLLSKKSSQKLTFDKLWVDSDFFIIKAYKHIGNENVMIYNCNDTIYINARSQIRPIEIENPEEIQKKIKESPPFEIKGAALLGYFYKGKRKYKIIDEFKILNPVYYP